MKQLSAGIRMRMLVGSLSLVGIALLAGGCAYLQNRGNDASDCIELGVTISGKPGFMVFNDCYSILPIGYSRVEDAKLLGWGNRQIGLLDFEHNSWGVVLAGSYKQALGEFDARDPHLVSRHADDPTTWGRFDMGIVSLALRRNGWRPFPAFFECDKGVHLGWVGLHLKYRWLDLVDFALGFTTLDIMGDDIAGLPPIVTPPQTDETTR
jgi:hypothetical protein